MALIIEDGTLVDGANSFIEITDADAYIASMGYSSVTFAESDLIQAYVVLRGLPWCQSHDDEFTVTQGMKDCQAEIAYRINQGLDIGAPISSELIKRDKVDVLETEWFKDSGRKASFYSLIKLHPVAYNHVKGLLCAGSQQWILRA